MRKGEFGLSAAAGLAAALCVIVWIIFVVERRGSGDQAGKPPGLIALFSLGAGEYVEPIPSARWVSFHRPVFRVVPLPRPRPFR